MNEYSISMQMEHLKPKGIMGKMTKACLKKPKKKRRKYLKVNQAKPVKMDTMSRVLK